MTNDEFLTRLPNRSVVEQARYLARHRSIGDLTEEEQDRRMWALGAHECAKRIEQERREWYEKRGLIYDPDNDIIW